MLTAMKNPMNIILTLFELNDSTTSGILNEFLKQLVILKLNYDFIKNYLISVTCDGVSVMLGRKIQAHYTVED